MALKAETDAPRVEIIEAIGEWFVRILEDGHEYISAFENEAFASSYSDGQRLRLGLEKVERS